MNNSFHRQGPHARNTEDRLAVRVLEPQGLVGVINADHEDSSGLCAAHKHLPVVRERRTVHL